MKPLFVLWGTFVTMLIATRIFCPQIDYALSGKTALAVMLLFTSMGHFMFTKGMTGMLPAFVPFRVQLIYATGLLEIAAAIGLFVPRLQTLTGVLLIVFFVLILPANVYAAQKYLNYETGKSDGKGPSYLWFRIPFQLLLIFWTYFCVIGK